MLHELAVPIAAAFAAGAVNAIAGGGSFLSFPALVMTGMPSVAANATSTAALLPGSLAGAHGFRVDQPAFDRSTMRLLLFASVAGGVVGAGLLLVMPSTAFDAAIPWLLLVGSVCFALGPRLADVVRRFTALGRGTMLVVQLLLGVYCGYFGAAAGLMMLATWTAFGLTDLRAMNAAKNLLIASANLVAVICFLVAREVRFEQAACMAVAAAFGAFLSARFAKGLDPKKLRLAITLMNAVVTVAFFLRWLRGG